MLYNVVVNDWGETTYVPTALGNVLLVVVLIALLAVAVVFARKQRNKTGADDVDQKMAHSKLTVKQLAFCAMAIALGTVLSNIKLFHFPTGGFPFVLFFLLGCSRRQFHYASVHAGDLPARLLVRSGCRYRHRSSLRCVTASH